MRVLHVIPSIGPLRGGPSLAIGMMARALRDAAVQVDVATTNDNDRELLNVPIGEPVDEAGVRYWYFERTAYPYTTSTGLARWLRTNVDRYQLVHAHALFSFSTSVAGAAARKRRVPFVIRPLGTLARYGMQQHALLKRASWLLLERRLLARAAGVHFTSEAEKEEAELLGDWRSFVVPLAVECTVTEAKQPKSDGIEYLFLSRIHPKKRVELLLRAFAVVLRAQPQARLTIAGTGDHDYVRALQSSAAALGVTAQVSWTGHVTDGLKNELLQRAHAFVLPSINENFGIAAVEAMAAGVPVVLTRGVAIHREVTAAGAGLVADDSAESVAAAMLAVTQQAPALGERARALVREKFSMTAMQQGLLDMYREILAAA